LLKEKFQAIAPIYVVDEDDAFPFDQLELEDHIGKKEFIDFRTSGYIRQLSIAVARSHESIPDCVLAEKSRLIFIFL
jgi:hypothetical protein